MAYGSNHFDWLTNNWAALLASSFNGGTYGDYLDDEMLPDPDADPVVGADEAVDIVTAEFGNLVTTFMRECHQALEGVRAFRLRTTAGGGTALSIGSISDGQTLIRSGSSIIGATGVAPGTHAASHLPGGSDALTTAAPVAIGLVGSNGEGNDASFARSDHEHAATYDVPQDVGTENDEGAEFSFSRSDHVHALRIEVLDAVYVPYEVDFSSLANNTFANGTESIDGRNWTAFSVAAAGTFDVLASTGIRWIPAVSTAGVFNETNQTAAGLYIDVETLVGPTFHPSKRYSFELYYSARTLNTSTRVGPFLWAAANAPSGTAARVRGGGVNNSAGTHVAFSQQQSTAANGGENVSTHNVFAITVEPNGFVQASSGIWSSGWPVLSQRVFSTTVFSAPSGLNRGDTRFVISHSHSSQNPVVDTVVLERLRVVQL